MTSVLVNIGQLATCPARGGQDEIGLIADAAVVFAEDRIRWFGPRADLPRRFAAERRLDAGGGLVVPGLVDCHTHLAFGGWRAGEFEQRILGVDYLEIARRGGGIASTVEATRLASEEHLLKKCRRFLTAITALGVTSMECKSGYGLDLDSELKLLRVYRRLSTDGGPAITPTFLGAHIVPAEFQETRERYIQLLTEEMIPAVANQQLAEFCDVFVEESAFSPGEARQILETGLTHGLRPKIHADQLTSGGGAELAAELGAISADHLEQVSPAGIDAMARTNVVAVTLPLAALYLGQPYAPARRMIDAGVAVAVATDFNPGSAPSYDLHLAMLLACTGQRMTPAEVLKGVTRYAARAIGREDQVGSIEEGKQADFVVLDAADVNEWLYHFRRDRVRQVWQAGQPVSKSWGHQEA